MALETISTLANKYHVSDAQIRKWTRLETDNLPYLPIGNSKKKIDEAVFVEYLERHMVVR